MIQSIIKRAQISLLVIKMKPHAEAQQFQLTSFAYFNIRLFPTN